MFFDILKYTTIKKTLLLVIILILSFFLFFGFTANKVNINLYNTIVEVQNKELDLIKFSQELKNKISNVQDMIIYQVSNKATKKDENFELVEESFPEILEQLNHFKSFAQENKDDTLIEISKNLNFKYIMYSSKAIELFSYDELDEEFFETLNETSIAANNMNKELGKLNLYSTKTLQIALNSFLDSMSKSRTIVFSIGILCIFISISLLVIVAYRVTCKFNHHKVANFLF